MKIKLSCTAFALALAALPLAATAAGDPFLKAQMIAENLEPVIVHPEQQKAVQEKLAALEKHSGRKPNILILLVDDLGWGDVGAYGGGTAVGAPTPHIDSLASGGLKLTSTYAQPTCTPTRSAMMTGRLPARTGLTRPILTGENPKVNPWASEQTAAGLLSAAGYRTALSGKWHLGEPDGFQPQQVGYDEYLGILSVSSEFSQGLDARLVPNLVLKPERMAALKKVSRSAITAGKRGELAQVLEPIDSIEALAQIDQKFANFSEDFIRRSVKAQKPFYLIHSFSRVHNDNYPAKGYAGKSPAGFPYKDAVVEVDDIVGRLMQTLKDTGQLDNTLVFFTSDNGPSDDLLPDSGYTPFRGGKGSTWEGGVRVPGIAYWPGMISAGRQSDGLFDLMDLFNTSLAVTGNSAKVPKDRYIDGIDQSSFLLSDQGVSNRESVYMYAERQLMAIRWEEFKVHLKVFDVKRAGANLDESLVSSTGMSPWVYNLYVDPKEQVSTGHRNFEWGLPRVVGIAGRHLATFQKYPAKDLGLAKPVQ
ncbi:arylsulfatase [Pseudomonas kielensis]|uniref:Arylsulfatase n=1 Tax=Pseudomonas kielensis TaxID=2762577 RepID=A0A7X1KWH1_9PSED|nr:arylsulfatase [Pseudomonas kielensis]MBC2688826.1 arylsulfatase [Pseudomonas kielensis]